MPTLWIFEDQLSLDLASLHFHPTAPVLMVESDRAFRQFKYHKKRLTFLVSAMRHFCDELLAAGRTVHYFQLQAEGYKDSLAAIRDVVRSTGDRRLVVVDPSDHHTREWVASLPQLLNVDVELLQDTLFLTDRRKFADWVTSLPGAPVMEIFYRMMRVKHHVLMDGRKPVGGRWNFDKMNRKPARGGLLIPAAPSATPDAVTTDVMAEVDRRFADHPGSTADFDYPVTRAGAEAALNDFLDHRLPSFGDWEDAMLVDQPLLYHSRLSSLINAGLIRPMDVIRGAEARLASGAAPLNAVEGFVRQILGWREYMRGIYHTFMPEYRDRNARGTSRPLPDWFWTADTDMRCLRHALRGVVDHAYSHHIQRLMLICNFATLAGLSPQAVNDWFLQMYIDSHDWVVTPNVVGMGMNADGGTCATKPYVSSASYINRMSDYCRECKFDPAVRTGPNACPFNFLYWSFLAKHRAELSANPRVSAVLKHLDRMSADELTGIRKDRDGFLRQLNAESGGKYGNKADKQ